MLKPTEVEKALSNFGCMISRPINGFRFVQVVLKPNSSWDF